MMAQRGSGTLQGSSILGLFGWIAITAGVGAVGAIAAANSREFYASLQRPEWAPPASRFGPVWSVLYLMMAIAAWLVWRARNYVGARVAIGLFLVQLALNALWTWLFFAWRQGALAFADSVFLWVAVTITINMFWRVRALAGALLVPYLAWVSFATALTYAVWRGNPGIL